MLPYQQRVIDEKAELDEKRSKLSAFIGDPIFTALPEDDQTLLKAQAGIMEAYSNILGERIARF